MIKGLTARLFFTSALLSLLLMAPLASADKPFKTRAGEARYIVLLDDPSLVERLRELEAGTASPLQLNRLRDPRGKLLLNGDPARAAMAIISDRFDEFRGRMSDTLGRETTLVHRYRAGVNGFSTYLTGKEALRLAKMDGVRSVRLDEDVKLDTDAGPRWVGAERVWDGEVGLAPNRGEGVVIGVIDSGINFEHPSFSDPGAAGGGHDHDNPYPEQLGLCSEAEVPCNDKLVGVYDFVEDDPNTEVEEENNLGRDNGAHGAHTAGTAGGNPTLYNISGANTTVSGVAPNANIISYRVCFAGDPDDPEDDACQGSAIIRSIDQAILDGVDVINYSIGGGAFDPWESGDTLAFLQAVSAGIFVATSAGNSGPGAGTIGRPANAPWITAVGSATHDRRFGGVLRATQGGETTPPGELLGDTFVEASLGMRPIVYAGDFGNALCGTGPAELAASCDENTGASNPFPPGTFNGEIVVCDRGTYGRIEKSKNLQLAGAGGYVLANTQATGGEPTFPDEHCLPSVHLPASRGDALRAWLAGGSGHMGSIDGFELRTDPLVADRMSGFSSRGPTPAPAEDILKPNVIAPGQDILAADNESTGIISLSGTSMASPHVAGAAALMLADNPNLSPAQVASMLELSATDANAKDENFGPADHFDTGAGRIRVDQAIAQGLYLDETVTRFFAADPSRGGDPSALNLATLTQADCPGECSFTRTVGALVSGSWNSSVSDLADGLEVTVTPESFSLAPGQTQELRIDVRLNGVPRNRWAFGKVNLDSPGRPRATMPLSVLSSAGELPTEFALESSAAAGFELVEVGGLTALPQATFTTGGLQAADESVFNLPEDPSFETPYDGGEGVETVLINVAPGALWLHTETLESDSEDVDLFVGFDSNNDGIAQEREEICFSTTPDDIEFCDIFNPRSGTWWVIVQNWEDGVGGGSGPPQDITLLSTVVVEDPASNLVATGPGITGSNEAFDLRLSWDRLNAPEGSTLFGAVAIGETADQPRSVGVVPVRLERLAVETDTTPLLDDREVAFALAAGSRHESLFVDVPPGVNTLDVRVASGSALQNNELSLELVRLPFDQAFANAPGLVSPSAGSTVASSSGSNGQGPRVTLNGGVSPGRYYAVLENGDDDTASIRVTASLADSGGAFSLPGGLWDPASRPGINQGFDYTIAGANRAFVWYTYTEDGAPAWYIASAPNVSGNSWTADLLYFTNDGTAQAATAVGAVGITMLDERDAVFSWTLFGVSGSDRMRPSLPFACPEAVSPSVNFSGLWFKGSDGEGGATVSNTAQDQSQLHYLYDAQGRARWLLGAGPFTAGEFALNQYSGFCPTCTGPAPSFTQVGTVEVGYDDNETGVWNLDYQFLSPAAGAFQRSNDIQRLTDELACPAGG